MTTADGSGRGAALAAAVAERIKRDRLAPPCTEPIPEADETVDAAPQNTAVPSVEPTVDKSCTVEAADKPPESKVVFT